MNPVGAEEVPASMQALIFEVLVLHRPSGWFVYEKRVFLAYWDFFWGGGGGERGGWYVLLIFTLKKYQYHHPWTLQDGPALQKKMGHLFTQRVVPGSLAWEWPSKNWDSSSLRELCEDPIYLQMALQRKWDTSSLRELYQDPYLENGPAQFETALHWENYVRIHILRWPCKSYLRYRNIDGAAKVT